MRNASEEEIVIENCIGQRYIAAGSSERHISVIGTPGNALGAYLNGTSVRVEGNVQEATGDTMNCGSIVVNGSAGDATGYAMRGGVILVRGDVGYRCGIHMKAYRENKPAIGNFCGTGMHGGEIYLRCEEIPPLLPAQVRAERVSELPEDVRSLIGAWCGAFGEGAAAYLNASYIRLVPNSANPYKQMYTDN
mgnify:CR=1 FL=1